MLNTMINSVSPSTVRDMLDVSGLATQRFGNDIRVIITNDEEIPFPIVITFRVSDNWIMTIGQAANFELDHSKRALILERLNKWSLQNICITPCLSDNGALLARSAMLIDLDVSEKYVLENCLLQPIKLTVRFFKQIYQMKELL